MTLHQNVGGTWKPITVWQNVAGTWRRCNVWKNIAGVWKQITSNVTLVHTLGTALNTIACTAQIRVDNDGNVYKTGGLGGAPVLGYNWNTGGAAVSGFEVQFEVTSGTATANSASSYQNCATDQSVTKNSAALNTPQSCSGNINIRPAGGGAVIATSTFTLNAERYS